MLKALFQNTTATATYFSGHDFQDTPVIVSCWCGMVLTVFKYTRSLSRREKYFKEQKPTYELLRMLVK